MGLPPATLVINGILVDFGRRPAARRRRHQHPASPTVLRRPALPRRQRQPARHQARADGGALEGRRRHRRQPRAVRSRHPPRAERRAPRHPAHGAAARLPARPARSRARRRRPPSLKPSIAVLAFRSLTRRPGLFRRRPRRGGHHPASRRSPASSSSPPRVPPQGEVADLRGPLPRSASAISSTAASAAPAGASGSPPGWSRAPRPRKSGPAASTAPTADVFDLQDRLTEAIVGTDRAHGPPRRDRPGAPQAARKPRCLRPLPPGAPPRVLERARSTATARSRCLERSLRARSRLSAGPRRQPPGAASSATSAAASTPPTAPPRSGMPTASSAVNADDPQADEHRRLRPRQSHPRLRRRDRGARPGARPQSPTPRSPGASAPWSAPTASGTSGRWSTPKRPCASARSNDPLNYHPYCALGAHPPLRRPLRRFGRLRHPGHPCQPGLQHAPRLPCRRPRRPRRHRCRSGGAARRLLEVAPRFSVSGFVRMELFRPQLTAAIAAALTRAGLPETPAG